jgi:uncharacterized protein
MRSHRLSLLVIFLLAAVQPLAAVPITTFNSAYVQNFDTLALVTGSVLPAGWSFSETGSAADATYAAGTGSSTTGNTYSFGSSNSTDRAFGTLRTSSLVSTLGTVITNQTGATLTELAIQYAGEQWRLAAIGRNDRLDFAYSLDATSLVTGTWINFDALDFIAPKSSGTTGALDGNLSVNRVALSSSISGLGLLPNETLWLRWTDFDAAGADDGLAIDDFSITAVRATPPQAVPDTLPSGMIALVLGLLVVAGRKPRARAVMNVR